MNKGLNIFLAVLLCVVVYIGLLLSFYSSKNFETSSPYLGDVRPTRGTYGTYAVSVGANSMGSDMAAISVRSANSMFRHRPVFSYAPAQCSPIANTQYPVGGMPSNSVASPISTTSSAEFRSFGGGGNGGGVSMSGGVATSSGAASAAGLTTTMPSTSMYAYANNRNASSVVTNDLMSSVSGDIAMPSSYAGIGNTTGPRGMSGRKNIPGIGAAEWTGWLDEEWEGGYDGITWNMLRDLYVRMTGDTDFSNEELWNSFLTWFEGNQSNDEFGWYWAPISDAVPVVLLLCLAYAFVIYRKTRQVKKANAEN